MPQDQHYLPQSYLRAWCGHDGRLFRYRRVGPSAKLTCDHKVPKSIGYEVDLYMLPPQTAANGLSGNQLEQTLALSVDERVRGIVARAASLSAVVRGGDEERELRWLMQTFVARGRSALLRVEAGVSELMQEQEDSVEALLSVASDDTTRAELNSFRDDRLPRVAARAGVAAVVAHEMPGQSAWLDGDIHVLQRAPWNEALGQVGAMNEFITYEEPVVEWEPGPYGLLATLSLSPDTLVAVLERESEPNAEHYLDMVVRHSLAPIAHQTSLICRSKLRGALLQRAAQLRPT